MKKTYLLILFIIFASQGFAKHDTIKNPTVPKEIIASFAKAHPDAKLMTWSKSNNIFIVAYREVNSNLWTTFDSEGKLLENKWKITLAELPLPVQDYIKKNNSKAVQEYYKIIDANGAINYEVSSAERSDVFDSQGRHFKTTELIKK